MSDSSDEDVLTPVELRETVQAAQLILLKEGDTEDRIKSNINWDENTMYDMERSVYLDAKNKYDAIEYIKGRYKRNESYLIGVTAYMIHTKYTQLMHMVHRCQTARANRTIEDLARNASSCRRLFYDIRSLGESIQAHFKNISLADIPSENTVITVIINDTLHNNTVENIGNNTGLRTEWDNMIGQDGLRGEPDSTTDFIDDDYELDQSQRRRNLAQRSVENITVSSRNIRKSMRFLDMADYTLRLQQHINSLKENT